ncbi:hypothetical protein [Edaphocola aurantiacus]|uniref:hypothetical protein n=1 Tax=Edaphocola aurantiacus TaxID=2601682 RepID=UPI001C982683|nr:hypothetical protein [Edaphocola aurantiacus]
MDKQALKNLFTGLPLWAKGILALVVVGVVVLIALKAKGILETITRKLTAKKAVTEVKNELKDLEAQGQKPTYTISQFKVMCDKLWQAMDGMGTDEDAIYDVFGMMKNDADVLMLISTYGTRDIDDADALWKNVKSLTLTQALASDMDRSEIGKINSILATKQINYRF